MDASCCTAEGNLYPGERSQEQALQVHVICNMLRTSGPFLVWILRAGSRRHFSIKKQSYIALNALGSTVSASACTHFGTSLRRLLLSLRDTLGPWRSPRWHMRGRRKAVYTFLRAVTICRESRSSQHSASPRPERRDFCSSDGIT